MRVKLSHGCVRLCRSPVPWILAALAPASFTFGPYFIYLYGQGREPLGPKPFGLLFCGASILLAGLFYFALGTHVVQQVRKEIKTGRGETA